MGKKRIIVGASGASGMPILAECLQIIRQAPQYESCLIMTKSAVLTLEQETSYGKEDMEDLADYVFKTDKDKAVFFFYFGKLRATEDVLMCKDETARAQLSVYPLMAQDTLNYMSTKYNDINYLPAVLQKTIDWDNANPERVSPIWSCYHGLDAFSQEPVLLDADKFPKIQKKVQKIVKNSIKEFKKEYKKHF